MNWSEVHARQPQAQEISPKARKNRRKKGDIKLVKWAAMVKARDGYVCKKCGAEEYLHAHHIKLKSEFPEMMYLVENGITVCRDCHADMHGGSLAIIIRRAWN